MLKGKNAVITGCLQGIGRETMRCFASHRANVWACALSYDSGLEAEAKQLSAEFNVEIKPVYFDLTSEEQIKTAIKAIRAEKKPVDCLVNIAGITHNALFHMTTLEAFHKVFDIDFFAQMLISQGITKLMLRGGGGEVSLMSHQWPLSTATPGKLPTLPQRAHSFRPQKPCRAN